MDPVNVTINVELEPGVTIDITVSSNAGPTSNRRGLASLMCEAANEAARAALDAYPKAEAR